MSEYRAASRYAKSILDLSKEMNLVEEVHNDMVLLSNTFKGSYDLRLLLKSPIIKDHRKEKILELIFGDKVNKLTISFLRLVTKKARSMMIESITSEFLTLFLAFKGIQKVKLTTTLKIDDALRSEIKSIIKKLTDKEPDLTEELSDDIIGGFILDIGDRRIDSSLKSKLEKIEFELTN